MSSKSKPFDAKAAKRFQNALLDALRALKTTKAASPTFLSKRSAVQIDRAIVAAMRAHMLASAEIDELARQMRLPHTDKPKRRRPVQEKLLLH